MAWIRSQDKTLLQKLTSIIYSSGRYKADGEEVRELKHFGDCYEDENGTSIGTFSTKEAALVELDKIEGWLRKGGEGVYQVEQG